MTRSPGFGSTARDYAPLSDSVSLRLPYTVKLATNSKSLTHYTKGTQSLLAELLLLVRTRWMPWRSEAMKDVAACEKYRGAGNKL